MIGALTAALLLAGPAQSDTLRLPELQSLAVARDARSDRAALERRSYDLRSRNLGVDRLPAFQLRGDAAYQSEVIDFPIDNPAFSVPSPPKDRIEVALEADWTIWDGGIVEARRATDEARLDGTLAGLAAQIHQTRVAVTEAFFSALLLQEQQAEVALLEQDLEARLSELRDRVEQGVALSGDTASLRAELLRAHQRRTALATERSVALAVLERLTGQDIVEDDHLALPDLETEVTRLALGSEATLPEPTRLHPQFESFEARRTAAERSIDIVRATARPQISVFGQLGYGSPGYDQFNDSLHEYWRTGVRVRWAPWNWDRRSREIEEARLQQQLIDTEERSFSDDLMRRLERPARTIAYTRSALESDAEIIALREEAASHAQARFEEGALSAAAYTDVRTDLEEARIAHLRHRVELARAQAVYLITLGVELR